MTSVAMITGASSGIRQATTRALSAGGWSVAARKLVDPIGRSVLEATRTMLLPG